MEESEKEVDVVKPRWFSKAWWMSILSALNYKQYSARDWAIDTLSSVRSYAMSAVLATAHAVWPVIVTTAKTVWIKAVALALAIGSVLKESALSLFASSH